MFISKSKKSPFYQLTYEVNGKRTTVSTKTKNLQDAYKFMANFSHFDESIHQERKGSKQQNLRDAVNMF
jgi:hypothetical protein